MKRAVGIILMILLLLTVVMTAFSSCSDGGITVTLGGKKIYADSPSPALWQRSAEGKTTLTLSNRSGSDAAFIIYTSSDTPRIRLDTASGQRASETVSFDKTDSAVGGIAVVGDITMAYVLNGDGLCAAAEDADVICPVADIEIEGDLTLSRHVKIYSGEYSVTVGGNLVLVSDSEGEFVLDSVEAGGFFADAPRSSAVLSEKTASYAEAWNTSLRSLNGKDMNNVLTVTSQEQLDMLCSPTHPLPLRSGDVLMLKDFEITDGAEFRVPLSLTLSGVTLSAPIRFECEGEGEIELTAENGETDPELLEIDAPLCSLTWQNSGLTVFDAGSMYNIKAFMGVDIRDAKIGGAAEELFDINMAAGDNMTGDILWQRTAPYTYTARLASPTAPSSLHDGSTVSIMLDGEEAEVVWDSFCSENGAPDLLSPLGTSFVSGGARYRLITESDCRIPVVVIDTDGAAVDSKEEYVSAAISVESDFSVDGLPSLDTTEVSIAGRGNSTWTWSAKKPYKLKFDNKVSVLGMSAAENWVLLANFADKALIRNYVALESAKVLDGLDCYATEYPVDVFVNGEYVGVYTMGEKVEVGEGRAYIKEDGSSVDCGYLLELNGGESRHEDEMDIIRECSVGPIKIVYPGARLTDKQAEYIKNYFILADTAVTKRRGAGEYVDLRSLADLILLNELTYNSDGCFRRSLFFAKDSGEPLRVSQVWDFDLAFGNSYADGSYEEWACLAENGYVNTSWTKELMNDKEFIEILRQRWAENKDALLAAATEAVDYGEYLVAPSAEANFDRWDIMYLRVAMQPEVCFQYHTFEDQVKYLKDFIEARWQWIDSQLKDDA